jgi:hypothetical protein
VQDLRTQLESVNRGLVSTARGMVVLFGNLQIMLSDSSSAEGKKAARERMWRIVSGMQEQMKS